MGNSHIPTVWCWFFPLGKFCRRVFSLPPSVRPSVCLSVRRSMLVRTITRQGFDLATPSLHRVCILGPSSALLKMGLIDLDLQGNFGLKRVNFRKFELVCAITRQGFDLKSPFLHRMCILGPFRTLLKMGSIDLDLQGHFGLKRVNFCKFELVCAITHQ